MRNFTICNAPQRSDEWFQARRGRLTGSCAKDMFATGRTKGEEAAAKTGLRTRLALERLTGRCLDDEPFVNKEMQRGIEMEPVARAAYEAETGAVVRCTGFLACDDLLVGCSLDGDVDNFTGIIEIKAPKITTHARYLKSAKVPAEHAWQIMHNMLVSGAAWCDFISWDDRFPPWLQLHAIRVHRDEAALRGYRIALEEFLAEVETEALALRTMTNLTEALEKSVYAV